MKSHASTALAGLLMIVALAVLAPAARAAFGPETFEAGTCVNHTCTYPSSEGNPKEAFTQAAGHPPWGITKFVMKPPGGGGVAAAIDAVDGLDEPALAALDVVVATAVATAATPSTAIPRR